MQRARKINTREGSLSSLLGLSGFFFVLFAACHEPAVAQVHPVPLYPYGPTVSSIIYGTLHLAELKTPEAALEVILHCLSLNITTFDLADVYAGGKALALFGEALALKPGLRNQIEVVAKMDIELVGNAAYINTSPEHINSTVQLYLKTLNTNYLDLVLFHWPDPLMDFDELGNMIKDLHSARTVKIWGTSNFSPYQSALLQKKVQFPFAVNEIEISPLTPAALTNGWVDYEYINDYTTFAWGPIGGDPFGGYNRLFYGDDPRTRQLRSALQGLATQMNTTMDVLCLAWLMRVPRSIVPIIGTTKPDRISAQSRAASVAAAMTREMWWQIAEASGVPSFGQYSPLP